MASSQAQRLKPHAIDVRVDINPIHWFLNDAADTRSSYYLEDAATEFQIQGLELDWICMTWDADLRMQGERWRHHSFKGKKWERMNAPERQQYLLNAYRVLLTRARQGMVIFVPQGDASDPTRDPKFYDETFGYLSELGIEHVYRRYVRAGHPGLKDTHFRGAETDVGKADMERPILPSIQGLGEFT